jgi:hypothetical protein
VSLAWVEEWLLSGYHDDGRTVTWLEDLGPERMAAMAHPNREIFTLLGPDGRPHSKLLRDYYGTIRQKLLQEPTEASMHEQTQPVEKDDRESKRTRDAIEHVFTYHQPTEASRDFYVQLRDKAMEFALLIEDLVPPSPDRTIAIRKVRESIMYANAALANNGVSPR